MQVRIEHPVYDGDPRLWEILEGNRLAAYLSIDSAGIANLLAAADPVHPDRAGATRWERWKHASLEETFSEARRRLGADKAP